MHQFNFFFINKITGHSKANRIFRLVFPKCRDSLGLFDLKGVGIVQLVGCVTEKQHAVLM